MAERDFRSEAVEALRESFRRSLDIKSRKVGGWEIVNDRDLTIQVYLSDGSYQRKPGGQVNSLDKVVIVANLQSGNPLYDYELNPLADALAVMLNRFTHPHVAGAWATGWSIDIRQDKSFDNIVTVNGEMQFRSRERIMPDEQILGLARATIALIQQEDDTSDEP